MEKKSLDEWIKLYEEKTGREFERDEKFRLFYYPEKGFCEIGVDIKNRIVIAYQACGDGWFWRRVIEFIASSLEMPCCGTICIRRIKPYIRLWGFKIERTEQVGENLYRYFGKDEYGKHFSASPAWQYDDTGEYAYYFTWEA